jgi:glycerol transport system permease protein
MRQRFSPVAFLYVAVLMTPVYWLVTMSFKTNGEIVGRLTLFPQEPTLNQYAVIFGDPAWYLGYVNALIYVCLNVVIAVTVAIPAAYAFSRHNFFGHRQLFFGLLTFRMMAPAILLVPFVQIFSDLELIDTHIAVALAHCFFNVPLAIWILEGFMSAVPRQIDQSARLDGYGVARFFAKILLPQIAPGIAVTAFYCFVFSWIEFLLANALTTVDAKPIAGIMTRAGGVLVGDFALLAAASVLGLLPGTLLVLFLKRHLVRGFSMGRVI